MFLAYFDESGDSGYVQSPTMAFSLVAVLVHDRDWLQTLDEIVNFRRYLKTNFGLPVRAELKAQWIIHNQQAMRPLGLSYDARLNLYRACMRFQRKVGTIRTFAIVINKTKVTKQSVSARDWAWVRAIERLERFGAEFSENIKIFPDEGHGYFIKRKIREMRRFHYVPSAFSGAEMLERRAANIIEDPSDRKSNESFFVQFADLNAYAAFRRVHPARSFDGSFWDDLGPAHILKVNAIRGGPPGIVSWP